MKTPYEVTIEALVAKLQSSSVQAEASSGAYAADFAQKVYDKFVELYDHENARFR